MAAKTGARPSDRPTPKGPKRGAPSEDDKARRDLKRSAAAHDRALQSAYQAGKEGEELGEEATDEERQAHATGVEERQEVEAARQAKAESRGRSSTGRGSSPAPRRAPARQAPPAYIPRQAISVGQQGAGLLLGLFTYALVISYLDYGWPGVTGWLSAKFTNKVTVGAPKSTNSGQANLIPNANPGTGAPVPQSGGLTL